MPTAGATAVYGAAYGFLPIGWIILNAVFLYNLTVETGQFEIVKTSVGRLSADRRIQALLVAFSFGAFIEGASGFGTPVAICSALLIGLGFTPLYAAGLSLIANTAPVAFGAIGTPILTLAAVTGIPAQTLGVMAGRQLPFVSLIVPAWLVVTMSGWRGLRGVWPAVLVCGGTFAIVQFAWSNYVGVELVDIVGGLASIAALALFSRVWQPRDVWEFPERGGTRVGSRTSGAARSPTAGRADQRSAVAARRRCPAGVDAVAVSQRRGDPLGPRAGQGVAQRRPAGLCGVSRTARGRTSSRAAVAGVERAAAASGGVPRYPVVPGAGRSRANRAIRPIGTSARRRRVFTLNWASATGTAILLAALATALYLRVPFSHAAPSRGDDLAAHALRRSRRSC